MLALIGASLLAALFWGLWAGFYVFAVPFIIDNVEKYWPEDDGQDESW